VINKQHGTSEALLIIAILAVIAVPLYFYIHFYQVTRKAPSFMAGMDSVKAPIILAFLVIAVKIQECAACKPSNTP
jgi:hypothetical protein